ncbi:MAG: AraC family transcriptional regulator [Acidobacteriota bacterium]
MSPTDRRLRLARAIAARAGAEPERPSPDLGLLEICHRRPTRLTLTAYEPSLCLILQGAKEVKVGDRELELRAGDSVIVSHHVPLLAGVTEASPSAPFVALAVEVDLDLIRGLYQEVEALDLTPGDLGALQVGSAEEALVEAAGRLFDLGERPVDAHVLGPSVRREIHYRLLVAGHGHSLRALARPRSQASQISRAVAELRRRFAEPLSVADLARTAGMSASTFHDHFKRVTSTTPLQFQKSLRLIEARRLLQTGGSSVTEAAFEVGYQSPTQFSREYSRRFGHAPRYDVASG